eukprot:COSAG06_NODE_64597_length_259_cov_0.643750_1_plen_52_part_10
MASCMLQSDPRSINSVLELYAEWISELQQTIQRMQGNHEKNLKKLNDAMDSN